MVAGIIKKETKTNLKIKKEMQVMMEPDEMKKKARVGAIRAMMMAFAPFPVSSSRHQRSIFHRELLKVIMS